MADHRRPVPDDATQEKLLQEVREIFHAEWVQADSDEKRLKLAKNLMEEAGRLGDDPDSQFVLLRVARDIASKIGNLPLAILAADALARRFAVDDLAMKADVLEKSLPTLDTAAEKSQAAKVALVLIDMAVRQDDFERAPRLGELALTAARESKDSDLSRRVVSRNQEVANIQAAYQGIAEARQELLTGDLLDPVANRKIGAYLCLAKGEWERGISYLALGGDDPICRAAQTDLAAQVDAATELAESAVKVGNQWWDASEQQTDEAAKQLRARACSWYVVTYKSLTGLEKTRVAKRLGQLQLDGTQPQKIVKVKLPPLPRVKAPPPARESTRGREASETGGAASRSGSAGDSRSAAARVRWWGRGELDG